MMDNEAAKRKKRSFSEVMSLRKTKQYITAFWFLLIPLILLVLFTYVPLVDMIRYSFYKWDGFGKMKFIGVDNYVEMFTKPEYFRMFKTSFYYLIGSFIQIGLALVFAALLMDSKKTKFTNFFKGAIFFPYLVNGVAVGLIFLYFYQPGGTLDTLLTSLGFSQETLPLWMKTVGLNNVCLAIVSLWRYLGQNMVMFAGSMQSVDGDLYEAAALDGANQIQIFRYIILPNIKTVISINMILAVKGAISVFEIPYIMTDGANGTATFVTKTLEVAFTSRKIGMASAMGVVLLILIMIITFIQKRFFEKEG